MAKTSSARAELESYLSTLDLPNKPTIHVNGKEHPSALVVVDFGAPLDPVRLNLEQSKELADRMRKFARDLLSKDLSIRVSSDNYNGVVYWASIQ